MQDTLQWAWPKFLLIVKKSIVKQTLNTWSLAKFPQLTHVLCKINTCIVQNFPNNFNAAKFRKNWNEGSKITYRSTSVIDDQRSFPMIVVRLQNVPTRLGLLHSNTIIKRRVITSQTDHNLEQYLWALNGQSVYVHLDVLQLTCNQSPLSSSANFSTYLILVTSRITKNMWKFESLSDTRHSYQIFCSIYSSMI